MNIPKPFQQQNDIFLELSKLIKQKKQARNNYYRQRKKEELRQDVRVRSNFWYQVIRDCNIQIDLIAKKLKRLYCVYK